MAGAGLAVANSRRALVSQGLMAETATAGESSVFGGDLHGVASEVPEPRGDGVGLAAYGAAGLERPGEENAPVPELAVLVVALCHADHGQATRNAGALPGDGHADSFL